MVSPGSFRAIRIASAVVIVGLAIREAMFGASGGGPVHLAVAPFEVVVAAALVWKPLRRPAFWAALALTVQQMATYGLRLAVSFNGTASLDKVSLAICLFFPTLVTVLYLERQEEAEQVEREA
jgi:hypothetical protein